MVTNFADLLLSNIIHVTYITITYHSYVWMLCQLSLTLSRMLIEIKSKMSELTKSVGLPTVDCKFTVSDFCALINGIHFLNLGRSRIFPFDNAIVLPRSGRRSARVWHHQVRWCTARPFLSFDSQFCDPEKYSCVQIAYRLNSSSTALLIDRSWPLLCLVVSKLWIYFFLLCFSMSALFIYYKDKLEMLFLKTWTEF